MRIHTTDISSKRLSRVQFFFSDVPYLFGKLTVILSNGKKRKEIVTRNTRKTQFFSLHSWLYFVIIFDKYEIFKTFSRHGNSWFNVDMVITYNIHRV